MKCSPIGDKTEKLTSLEVCHSNFYILLEKGNKKDFEDSFFYRFSDDVHFTASSWSVLRISWFNNHTIFLTEVLGLCIPYISHMLRTANGRNVFITYRTTGGKERLLFWNLPNDGGSGPPKVQAIKSKTANYFQNLYPTPKSYRAIVDENSEINLVPWARINWKGPLRKWKWSRKCWNVIKAYLLEVFQSFSLERVLNVCLKEICIHWIESEGKIKLSRWTFFTY